ncbi:YpuI family protein [Brevibacillus porteri]|uniref:YpuI family protein n=1 Tax=Brevibacillus porteri TaxID=2126350 RepID=UPI003D257951
MSATHLKQLCEETYTKLKKVSMEVERFLNQVTLAGLVSASGDPEEFETYYRNYLSDLRHLLVHCENAYERLGVSLRRARFHEEFAEEVLYQVYHTCINNFYYPKGEVYEEDGRLAYTGQDCIIFRKQVVPELQQLTLSLSRVFEPMRNDLQYYETDYIAKKSMQKEKAQA